MGVTLRSLLAIGLLLIGASECVAAADKPYIVVFAAASLADALQEIGDGYSAAAPVAVKFSFAASSVLARQIESGAMADVFFSADGEWMDYLQSHGLIDGRTRRDVLGNTLVLIAPRESRIALKITANFALAAALGGGRLACADPQTVPAGRYAHSALANLGVWNQIQDRLARAENVRSALAFVERGEVPLGIVYGTDARLDPRVRVVDIFPPNSHEPIIYPMALTRTPRTGALEFVDYLTGPAGTAVFKKYGFTTLTERAGRSRAAR